MPARTTPLAAVAATTDRTTAATTAATNSAASDGTNHLISKAVTPAAATPNFWVAVVSRNHVANGVAGSFAQVNHGKAGPLERMRAGDGFACYSPRTDYPDGPPLQAFTAIGRVREGVVYQADPARNCTAGVDSESPFRPYRLAIDYFAGREAAIKPLLAELSFIRSKTHWGAAFRFGLVRVPPDDFARIARAMGREFELDFPAFVQPQHAVAR